MDAPTGSSAQKNPFPVLVRLKADAILPNRYTADVKECFVVSSGFGDLSSERAYIRAESISCVRQDGGVIEVPWMRMRWAKTARLVFADASSANKALYCAMHCWPAFCADSRICLVERKPRCWRWPDPLAWPQPRFNAPLARIRWGGALRGTGYAMERLANYYIDYAENLFPVIEIDVTRKINLVVQRGTKLRLLEKVNQ